MAGRRESAAELRAQGYVLTDRIAACIDAPHVPQRTDEWFRLRATRITGSVADTILGTNSFFNSYETLVLEKAGMPTEFRGNEATRHGQLYEDEALAEYARRTGRRVVELGLVAHASNPLLAHSPDGIGLSKSDPPVLLEVKCPLTREIKPGKVPKYYSAQLQLGLEVFDLHAAHFIQYRPSPLTYDQTVVPREAAFLAKAQPKFERFWADVQECARRGWQRHPTVVHKRSLAAFQSQPVVNGFHIHTPSTQCTGG